ncbi:hypothetical protein B0H63DRAFT_485080 [Podospora didyma]|uniref:Uncharacterized protein n=1 Tax=Podospora didyma TaxID=330526 RepID=A0AAE0KAN2_9PEZI|nr:hypothetical protein B0H63DRAFT_485080 [Podospora didyma]
MSSPKKTMQAIQNVLEPYIRPRDEVAHIRRILALHLDSCVNDGSTTGPLALVESSSTKPSSVARGLQREYLEALNANIKARNEHKACLKNSSRLEREVSTSGEPQSNRLEEHLAIVSLQKKQERLQAVEKHLDSLKQKPAASPDFLDPGEIFRNSKPLPDVPGELVSALALDKTASSNHLKDLIDQLEKHVLRTKLLLKREEQLLEQVRSRSSARPGSISPSAKLEALNTTRAELINWIETELGKASDDHAGNDGEEGGHGQGSAETTRIDEQLVAIKEKYTRYLGARKGLFHLVSQQPRPVIEPQTEDRTPRTIIPTSAPVSSTHLLSPYLENLLSIAHEQKGLIMQKSHLNVVIAKQVKDNCQALDRLAEESQLIPSHPVPGGAPRHKQTFGHAVSSSASELSASSSSRVKPWVFAAESAKILTFEAVAEKIEEGQIALESSMRTIGEIEQLFGRRGPVKQSREEEEDAIIDDIWMQESGNLSSRGTKHATKRKTDKRRLSGDVWDMVDGNLGLLRSEGDPP